MKYVGFAFKSARDEAGASCRSVAEARVEAGCGAGLPGGSNCPNRHFLKIKVDPGHPHLSSSTRARPQVSEQRIDLGLPCCRTTCSCVRERTRQTSEVRACCPSLPRAQLCRAAETWGGSLCPSPPADEDSRVVIVGGFCVGRRQGNGAQLLSDNVPAGFCTSCPCWSVWASNHSVLFLEADLV